MFAISTLARIPGDARKHDMMSNDSLYKIGRVVKVYVLPLPRVVTQLFVCHCSTRILCTKLFQNGDSVGIGSETFQTGRRTSTEVNGLDTLLMWAKKLE